MVGVVNDSILASKLNKQNMIGLKQDPFDAKTDRGKKREGQSEILHLKIPWV